MIVETTLILALPAEIAVTKPNSSTVAISGLRDSKVTLWSQPSGPRTTDNWLVSSTASLLFPVIVMDEGSKSGFKRTFNSLEISVPSVLTKVIVYL